MKRLQRPYVVSAFIFIIVLFAYSSTSSRQQQQVNRISSDLAECDYWEQLDTINHFLPAETARNWIRRYKVFKDTICHNSVRELHNILPDSCQSFNKKTIRKILNLNGCIGLRIYLGMDKQFKVHFILGGVDSCGKTLLVTGNVPGSPIAKVSGDGFGPEDDFAPAQGFIEMGLDP